MGEARPTSLLSSCGLIGSGFGPNKATDYLLICIVAPVASSISPRCSPHGRLGAEPPTVGKHSYSLSCVQRLSDKWLEGRSQTFSLGPRRPTWALLPGHYFNGGALRGAFLDKARLPLRRLLVAVRAVGQLAQPAARRGL
jgi:hypothetical protein